MAEADRPAIARVAFLTPECPVEGHTSGGIGNYELCLRYEVERRDAKNLEHRVERVRLSELAALERFDWSARITIETLKDDVSLAATNVPEPDPRVM